MKNYFNGNIKKVHRAIVRVIYFCSAVFFLLIALYYDNCDFSARVLLTIFSILMFVFLISPIIIIHAVKNRKNNPHLAKLLVKLNRFTNLGL